MKFKQIGIRIAGTELYVEADKRIEEVRKIIIDLKKIRREKLNNNSDIDQLKDMLRIKD